MLTDLYFILLWYITSQEMDMINWPIIFLVTSPTSYSYPYATNVTMNIMRKTALFPTIRKHEDARAADTICALCLFWQKSDKKDICNFMVHHNLHENSFQIARLGYKFISPRLFRESFLPFDV